ncbi:hypothetical protein [Polaromonas aquatica]|uniref:hypothetical protein n=1 Tax=Polaromonas aquatica TaxID=332657 RepID=UPI003D65530B
MINHDRTIKSSKMAIEGVTGSVDAHWQAFMAVSDGARLNAELLGQMGRGAALLLRVAKASPEPDARVVERWLTTMMGVSALACAALDDVQ